MPKKMGAATAVAATEVADAKTSAVADEKQTAVAALEDASQWQWGEKGNETMHPFWAVRRMTEQQLNLLKLQAPKNKPAPRFNCELVVKTLSVVAICSVDGQCYNRTRIMEAPFLTNSIDLMEEEELFLEVEPPAKKTSTKKRTWRDAEKDEEKQQQKRAREAQREADREAAL